MPYPYSLGRVAEVEHDERSLQYAHGVLPRSAVKPVRWLRRAPVFDQRQIGSCTGNAAAGLVGTDNAVRQGFTSFTLTPQQAAQTHGVFIGGRAVTVDEQFAVLCYELNTRLDTYTGTYKPDDTGSDGLAAAKTLQTLALCDVYTHAFTLDALDSALQTGPVMVGTTWLQSMFAPTSNDYIPVDQATQVSGGHEYVIDELLPTGDYGMQNSWGTSWGQNGRAYLRRADMQWLLSQNGDVTIPHLTGASPTPTPTGAVTKTFQQADWDEAITWANKRHYGVCARVAGDLRRAV